MFFISLIKDQSSLKNAWLELCLNAKPWGDTEELKTSHSLFVCVLCFLFFSWSCRGLWWPLIWSKPQLVETFSAGTLFWQWVALYVQRTDTGAIVIINGDECQTICVVFFFFCVRLPCFNLLYRASYHAKKHPLHLTGFGPQHNHYAWPRALQKVIHSCDSRCWLSLGCYE